ncbi:hypothetical protein ACTPEM_25495, partial [Clostridioides difficile]
LIWKYITANKKHCSKMSINELAMKCNVSRATITRFVKKLDLKVIFSSTILILFVSNFRISSLFSSSFDLISFKGIPKYFKYFIIS